MQFLNHKAERLAHIHVSAVPFQCHDAASDSLCFARVNTHARASTFAPPQDGKHWVPTSNQSQLAGGEKRGLLGGNVKRRKVSRKDKVSVGFDSEDRTEYLTGFKKRKDERRAVAIQEMIMKERKDRLEERRKRRKDTKEMLASKGITAGVPSIVLDTGGAGKVEEKNT